MIYWLKRKMQKKIFFIILSFTFCFKPQMTFESVQKGKDLEKISEISFDEFFQLWLKNRRKLKPLFEDVEYAYFGKTDIYKYTWNTRFFKINKNLLQTEFPNYQTFFAEDLEIYYFDHLRSKKGFIDLDRLENQDWKECGPDYSYSLIHQKVAFQIRWKVDLSCSKLSIFQGRIDNVYYDLNSGKISQ
ncbi:hypothetical protein LEP1GSC086_3742 [Leptospira weilii str. LNT 1234]|nr:hypothetical protein LEP1GSC086_3742 [Leptospira weilii str. LNT 1234]